jgi:cell division protease FtsH
VLFGGRAAEELVFGDVTTGAHDDIRKATDLARRMVTEYGMSKKIGAVNYARETGQQYLGMPGSNTASSGSPVTAEIIEAEIRQILERCHQRSRTILRANRVLLEEMAVYLLEKEVLDGERMEELLARAQEADSWEDRPPTETEEIHKLRREPL